MKITVNIKKRYVFAIIGVIVLFFGVFFVMGQTATSNPRHDSDQIWVKSFVIAGGNSVAQSLENWLLFLANGINTLDGRVDAIEPHYTRIVEEGPEIYAGTFNSGTVNHYSTLNIPKSYLNGISKIRFKWRGNFVNAAYLCPENADIICGNGNPAGPGSWSCTCIQPQGSAGGQSQNLITGTCSGSANWVTFNVRSVSTSTSVWLNGFTTIDVEFCHAAANTGSGTIDVYVTPYVIRTNSGYRIGAPATI